MEYARQRYDLDIFLFYRSHGVSGRPGYRIDGVLSRGALRSEERRVGKECRL